MLFPAFTLTPSSSITHWASMLLIQRLGLHLNPCLFILLQYRFPIFSPLLSIKKKKKEGERGVCKEGDEEQGKERGTERGAQEEKKHKKIEGSSKEDCD